MLHFGLTIYKTRYKCSSNKSSELLCDFVVLGNWIIPILNNINKQTNKQNPNPPQNPDYELDWEILLMFNTINFRWVPEVHFP